MVSYRYVLVARWSRRDRLGVAAIAVAVSLLVGTTLLLAAVGTQTTALATGLGSNTTVETYDSPVAARAAAGDRSVTVPVYRAASSENSSVTVVALSPGANGTTVGDLTLPEVPANGRVRGPVERTNGSLQLRTTGGDVTNYTVVAPSGDRGMFPESWYVARRATVDRLPLETVLVLTPRRGSGSTGRTTGVPVVSTVGFFVAGTRSMLGVLWPLTAGAAILAGVVVFSVTRMSVRDRTETIYVARATGATPRTVLALVTFRAFAMTILGVALGYALGVIVPVVVVNGATSAGVPTTLDLRVTGRILVTLAPPITGIVLTGTAAGALAGRPAVRAPPATLLAGPSGSGSAAVRSPRSDGSTTTGSDPGPDPDPRTDGDGGRIPGMTDLAGRVLGRAKSALGLTLLDYRAAVPTTATLSVFVAAVLVVTALGATVTPLTGDGAATIVEPDAPHPVSSRVEAGYADAVRDFGVAASPEILSFQVGGGDPFLARGANYTAFARVSDARIVRGRAPASPREAVVGADLAEALGVSSGDHLLLGGRSEPRLDRVEVVGVYRAPGLEDDQLVVSLPVARHLTNTPAGTVDFVRLERALSTASPAEGPNRSGLVVSNVSARRTNGTVRVRVTLRNLLGRERERVVAVGLDDRSTTRRVAVPGATRRTIAVAFPLPPPGTHRLSVTDPERPDAGPLVEQSFTVRDPDALVLGPVPRRAPPNATLVMTVTDGRGRPVENATVRVGDRRATTTKAGLARVRVPPPGEYEVTAERPDADGDPAHRALTVERAARRSLLVDATVSPTAPTVETRPTVRVRVRNPWATAVERTVRVAGPNAVHRQRVRLAPGERTTVTARLGRAATGRHAVQVAVDGHTVARPEYVVRGGERIVSALATSGYYRGASGLGQSVRTALGNLEVLLGTLLALVAVATVGTVAAGFAAAVDARRSTVGIYRATGATRRQVLGVILGDAVRVCAVAVPSALVVGSGSVLAVRSLGWLTVFGITVTNPAPGRTLLGAAVGGLGIALVGAVVATWPFLGAPPVDVLDRSIRSGSGRSAAERGTAPERGDDGRRGTTRDEAGHGRGPTSGRDPGRSDDG